MIGSRGMPGGQSTGADRQKASKMYVDSPASKSVKVLSKSNRSRVPRGVLLLALIDTELFTGPALAAHPSALNKKFVDAFKKANNGLRPNFMAVGGYDGMRVIYEALKNTKGGQGGGDALLAAMKGQIFESPRGQIFIDAQTRDIVQNIYLRRVEKKDGELYNVEFDVIKEVKDPGKTK